MKIIIRKRGVELPYKIINNKDCRNISGVNTGWEWRGKQE